MEERASQELAHHGDRETPRGYLALPERGDGLGVLVLHAWWGLNDTIRAVCTRLAEAGFVAFAPDLYHGKVVDTIADAEILVTALDSNQAMADIADATRFLNERAGQTDRGLAVIGFSLGASYALDLAGANPEHIRSVVLFYGTGGGDFSAARAAYLGHFAENDPYEPLPNVDELEEALRNAGRPVTFYRYPGAGHWFFEPDRVEAYNQAAASLAWERTLTFLKNSVSTRLRQQVHAPRAAVYRALLDPRAVATWMVPDGMTSQVHEFDAREGGAFRISLTYDTPSGTGKTTAHTDTYHGRFITLVPDERVVQVMEFETDDPTMRGEMTATFTLIDKDGGTEVLAVHDHLPPGISPADNETGWRMSLEQLARLVEADQQS